MSEGVSAKTSKAGENSKSVSDNVTNEVQVRFKMKNSLLEGQITIRLSEKTLQRLNKVAQRKFCTRVDYARRAIETALDRDLPSGNYQGVQLNTTQETLEKLKALSEGLEEGQDVLSVLFENAGLGAS